MHWANLIADGGVTWRSNCHFAPAALLGMSMATTAIGGAMSAAGTLAGGGAAQQAGEFTKNMDIQNASQALASGQRKSLDTQDKTRMLESTATARAGASGVDAGVGSPASTVGDIAQRGSYHALMDMFNGQSEAVGLQNQGTIAEWEGNQKKSESQLAAAGTLAGSAGSMFQQYGRYNFPSKFGPRY